MKFRLHYDGPLESQSNRPRENQRDNKRSHKHDVRRVFSCQIQHLWETMPSLKAWQSDGEAFGVRFENGRVPMVYAIHDVQPDFSGKRFIPLVCKEFDLLCKIEILLLRRDKPGSVFVSRDIDNRLKVLIDALTAPSSENQIPSNIPDKEKVFYVLLKDDSLMTSVSVETDELLAAPEGADDAYVKAIISVDLSIYRSTPYNFGVF